MMRLLFTGQKGIALASALLFMAAAAPAQIFEVDTSGKGVNHSDAPVDRRYAQVTPTHIELSQIPLTEKARILLERDLQSEQGFAMRPLHKGHKGLTLRANGALSPAGENYLNMVTSAGLSAKPGDRLVITDVKIDKSNIVLLINGGPDFKHRLLRHIDIGTGNATNPVVQDTEPDPQGARLTLTFEKHVPELTAKQVKDLLGPLVSFDVKTPIQAFTDTLPVALRDAIVSHQVWVGMSVDMVLFAKGQPRLKTHELDGQMPFDEWIYGTPPEEVDFVRINGNRVIRVEVALVGKKPQIFSEDRVEGPMRTDGSPVMVAAVTQKVRVEREGDVERDPNKQAPNAPPSLRKPGEVTQQEQQAADPKNPQKNVGVMKPVQPPKPHAPDPALQPSQPAETPVAAASAAPKPIGANPDGESVEAQSGQAAGAK